MVESGGAATEHADDRIMPWTLAMPKDLKVSDPSGLVYPYRASSEAKRRAAAKFPKPPAQNPWV